MLLAYFGPETTLPLTSVIATLVGGLLVGGRGLLRWAAASIGRILGPRKAADHRSATSAAPRRIVTCDRGPE
jgi:hypothetical protein